MNFSLSMETLPIMAKGMLGIFTVTAVIVVAIKGLTVLFEQK